MKMSKSGARDAIILAVMVILLTYMVVAEVGTPPQPTDSVTQHKSTRLNYTGATAGTALAEAGNVTEIVMTGTGVTTHWTGFYGNISGTLTLDNVENFTLYDWSVAEPQGKIYATISSGPVWESIECLNFTSGYNVSELEEELSMDPNDDDGINETFCPGCDEASKFVDASVFPGVGAITNHSEFYIGYKQFPYGSCWSVATYKNGNVQTADGTEDFIEVLLQDGTNAIYMTIIEDKDYGAKDGVSGFDNRNHDFQMIVGEDGNTTGDFTPTTYYFYVELN